MSCLVGYAGNEPEWIRCAILPARAALVTDVGPNPDGLGLGFYQGGEVLLQRRPKATPGLLDFYPLLSDLRSDIAIAHVRSPASGTPGGSPKSENTHPYRFRSWLFAHAGTVTMF